MTKNTDSIKQVFYQGILAGIITNNHWFELNKMSHYCITFKNNSKIYPKDEDFYNIIEVNHRRLILPDTKNIKKDSYKKCIIL